MATPTGTPPHGELASQLKEILNQVSEMVISFRDQTVQVTQAVKNAIDKDSWDSGHVTGSRLREILTTFQEALLGAVNVRLNSI